MNLTSSAVGLVHRGFTHYIAAEMAILGLARRLATKLAEPGHAPAAAGYRADLARWRSGS
jgi:hypothetical protein